MKYAVFLFVFLSLSSCFKDYIATEKEIRRDYELIPNKPNYQTLKAKNSQLYVATFGADTTQPILFIHGAPGRWDGFRAQLDDTTYQKKYHLLAPDRPGYGFSYFKRKHKMVNFEKQVEMLESALALNKSGKKAILVARSYGAPLAAYMISKKPHLYDKLIMMAPAIDPDAEKFFKFSKWGKVFLIRWFLPKRFNTATDEKYAHVAELRKIEPIWSSIQIPTVVMYGGRDWVVSPENFEYAKTKLANNPLAKYIFIPEAGHRISRSHAELLKTEVFR
jgi:pimeloyl-ACP methyl ester carboxylesterase